MPRYKEWQREAVRVIVVKDCVEFMFPRIFATCRKCINYKQRNYPRGFGGNCAKHGKWTAGVSSCSYIEMNDENAMAIIAKMERNLDDWPVEEWGFEPFE